MDRIKEICGNCGHDFEMHQMATFGVWYCDFEDSCECNEYVSRKVFESDDDSYLWN